MIKIKPHHFLDMIKLYGKGIEEFIPDERYHHNFYKIANKVLSDHDIELKLTIGSDDICTPCIFLGKDKKCSDKITHIEDIHSKNEWNEILDKRIMTHARLSEGKSYPAQELCEILFLRKELIFKVWKEESESDKDSRYHAFCNGARKFLGIL